MSKCSDATDRPHADLWLLVEAHCDGVATPDEQCRLEARLVADADARRFFVAYMQEQAQIAWLARGERVPDAVPKSPVLGFLGTAVKLSAGWLSSPKVLALTVAGCLAAYSVGLMIGLCTRSRRADLCNCSPLCVGLTWAFGIARITWG